MCLEAGKRSTQRCLNKTAFASALKNRWLPDRYCTFPLCGHKVSFQILSVQKKNILLQFIQPG